MWDCGAARPWHHAGSRGVSFFRLLGVSENRQRIEIDNHVFPRKPLACLRDERVNLVVRCVLKFVRHVSIVAKLFEQCLG